MEKFVSLLKKKKKAKINLICLDNIKIFEARKLKYSWNIVTEFYFQ